MEDLPGPDKSKISFLERPTVRDLWDLKGAILELMVVTALFFASLGNGDMRSILLLSIFVTVLATLLIIADMYDMRKKRDFRRIKLALLGLDAVVLIASGVVLHYWILNTDDVIGDEHVPTLFALDGRKSYVPPSQGVQD